MAPYQYIVPLCLQLPDNPFHLILYCPTTLLLWSEIQPFLLRLHPISVTKEEMAFGLPGNSPNILLRNWFTFLLRECIYLQENLAYHNHVGPLNERAIKCTYNTRIHRETAQQYQFCLHIGRLDIFKRHYTVNDALLNITNGEWKFAKVYHI